MYNWFYIIYLVRKAKVFDSFVLLNRAECLFNVVRRNLSLFHILKMSMRFLRQDNPITPILINDGIVIDDDVWVVIEESIID
ncbi:MAG: hypothetical protein Tsb0010_15310 [Parvularculaceae bacterium]